MLKSLMNWINLMRAKRTVINSIESNIQFLDYYLHIIKENIDYCIDEDDSMQFIELFNMQSKIYELIEISFKNIEEIKFIRKTCEIKDLTNLVLTDVTYVTEELYNISEYFK